MNKWKRAIAAIFALSTFSATDAIAASMNATVKSGQKTQVYRFTIFNKSNCQAAVFPKANFRQPKNGTFSIVKRRIPIPAGRRCAGKIMNALIVYYQSKPGYRGSDSGKFGFSYPQFVDGGGFKYYGVRAKIKVQ